MKLQYIAVVLVSFSLGVFAFSLDRTQGDADVGFDLDDASNLTTTTSITATNSVSNSSAPASGPTDGCMPPLLGLNGSDEPVGPPHDSQLRNDYTRIREVKFSGAIGPLGEKRLCKIKCIGGQWVGPLCVNQQDGGRYHPLFRSCNLEHINAHLLVTFRNITINNPIGWSFPHGARLLIRCRELGLYKLLGNAKPTCQNGAWSSRMPYCVPTTMLTNFTEDAPPTILIRIPAGSASVEPSGVLAVYPGSTVHLECLFSRRLGSPDWTWTSTLGQYLTGWAIATEEREWKYRLSVYYTKPQDSGTFTCATPRGITNTVTLHVTAVQCNKISMEDERILMRAEGDRLGQRVFFQCPIGYRLLGPMNVTCQASGKWSSSPPSCEPVRCPALDESGSLDANLQLEEHNASAGGRAVFRCLWGHRLVGSLGVECKMDGSWSGPPPKCIPVVCPPPVVSPFATLIDVGAVQTADGQPYAVGSLVQFVCDDLHQLDGEASIVCTETGFWSHPSPLCKPRCPYPGEPENGFIVPVKFSYDPEDMLQVTCNPGYESRLEDKPKCLPTGNWSLPLPLCTRYDQI